MDNNEQKKQELVWQEMEDHMDPVGSFEKYAKNVEEYTGSPPDKEDIYEVLDEINRQNIDDLIDEDVILPTEPINSWINERDEYGHVWELGWQESDRPHPGFGGTTDICGGYIEQCKRCGMYGYEFCPGSGRDSQYAFQKCGSKIR